MSKTNQDLAFYVSSPKSYEDIFSVFYQCFKKNVDIFPYSFYLSTNNSKYNDIIVLNNGLNNDTWVKRTIGALNYIKEDYILLMCDDLFLLEKPNYLLLNKIINLMKTNNYVYCRLPIKSKNKKIKIIPLSTHEYYPINLQLGIFKKSFLKSLLMDDNLNAWEIENKINMEGFMSKEKHFKNMIKINLSPLKVIHGVEKGFWIPSTYNKLKKEGFFIDSNRKCISKKKEIINLIKGKIGKAINCKFRHYLKIFLKKFGFHFTSDF